MGVKTGGPKEFLGSWDSWRPFTSRVALTGYSDLSGREGAHHVSAYGMDT